MQPKKNILVFPCGSEIALEIHRSLKYSTHYNLVGANSVDDHGKFIFENYVDGIPFMTDEGFIPAIKKVVKDYNIDAIYPAMDAVITMLKRHEDEIGCKVVGSELETVETCLSKGKTYKVLDGVIKTPKVFTRDEVVQFPVFGKPDVGYGSRGVKKIDTAEALEEFALNDPTALLCEYLPGDEYTVDCFTDKNGTLLHYMPRVRQRVMNGISVNTIPFKETNDEFSRVVNAVNEKITFRGAWFVQVKRDVNGELTLLEIAARLGGSSSLSRAKGVNLAQLTLFDAFDTPVSVFENNFSVELDRALDTVFELGIDYDEVFCDFDDCLLIEERFVNTELIAFLYQSINRGKKLTLLTRHAKDIDETLRNFRLEGLFDRVLHITDGNKKSQYIDNKSSIFIDDSFAERADVSRLTGVPVFGVDMIKGLLR